MATMNVQRVLITATTKTLCREMGESGVRSNAILPSAVVGQFRPFA
jgi:enoyl-[acyl-carrier-protein] reductase (NADH)